MTRIPLLAKSFKDGREVMKMVNTAKIVRRDTSREVEFYDIARRFAMKKAYSEEVVMDFPGWALTRFLEGKGSRVDWMFVDYMRAMYGTTGSARSVANSTPCVDLFDVDVASASNAFSDIEAIDSLRVLSDRDRDLVIRVVILGEGLREVAADTGLSMARISQIVKAALATLRDSL